MPAEDEKVIKDLEFESTHFRSETWIGSDFRNAKLLDCNFAQCTLSSVKVDGAVLQAHFDNCKLEGINFFTAKRSLIQLSFADSLIRYCSFAELKLTRIKFIRCTMMNVDFADADLTSADFTGSTFEDCTFRNTNLSKANFTDARGYSIDPTLNRIAKAKFSVPEVLALLAPFGIEIAD